MTEPLYDQEFSRRYDVAGFDEQDEWEHQPPTLGHRRRRRPPRWLMWATIVVAVGLLLGALGIVWVRHQINPSGKAGAQIVVAIPAGSSTAKMASQLSKAGIIHSPTVFRFYVKLKGAGPLQAGSYSFKKNSRYDAVISLLEKGPVAQEKHMTIPEGFNLQQIANRVGTLPGLSAEKFVQLATNGQLRSPLAPDQPNLEGLLFPGTYDVKPGDDEAVILQQMVDRFEQTATAHGVQQTAAQLGVTPYQVVIVASMVEREAKLAEDRGPIASVIYNRLKKSMPLQIDATLMYGDHLTDPHQINVNSATTYNTYKIKGLPPTPIASPGGPSLDAASKPPQTTYLYYVLIEPNGKQAFATTSTEFAKLRAQAKAKGLL